MKKLIILFIILFTFASTGHSFETITNPNDNNEFMYGCFSKPCTVNPGDILLSRTHIWNDKLFKYPRLFMYIEYRFLGRSSDKTFEISFRKKVFGRPESTRKLSLYFEKNSNVQLKMGEYNEKFWPPFGRIILKDNLKNDKPTGQSI